MQAIGTMLIDKVAAYYDVNYVAASEIIQDAIDSDTLNDLLMIVNYKC